MVSFKMKKLTTAEFIKKAIAIHSDTYDYLNTVYINCRTFVNIVCKIHGVFFQRPHDHLNGFGCVKCGTVQRTEKRKLRINEFIEKARKIHGATYDYSSTEYINYNTKLKISCNKHGIFYQSPSRHLRGSGCPSCAKSGFDPNKSAILYYLSILNGTAYKIGITNLSIKDRYGKRDLNKITIIKEWYYPIVEHAYKDEQHYLNIYKDYKYLGEPLLKTGNSELFMIGVLELDKI